jgi:hypothetical protein
LRFLMSQIFIPASAQSGVVDSVTGANGVTASPSTGAVVVSGVNATTTTVGVASFNSADFTVTSGAVSLTTSLANRFPITPFVVGPVGQAGYQTVAAGVAAAVAAGGAQVVWLQPGTYAENITLPAGIHITGSLGNNLNPTATIDGTVTYSAAGTAALSSIGLLTNGTFCIAVTGSAASILNVTNCYINCLSSTGISFTSSSSSAQLVLKDCDGNIILSTASLFSMSSPGTLRIARCKFTNTGNSTTANTVSAGTFNKEYNILNLPLSISGSAVVNAEYNQVDSSAINLTGVTLSGTCTYNGRYNSYLCGSASCISVGAGCTFNSSDSVFNCTATNAIAGAGSAVLGCSTFIGSAGIQNTLTSSGVAGFLPGAFGTTGQVLTSNGADVVPTFQTLSGLGAFTSINIQTFIATGTYTPTAGMLYCQIECIGGGAAGGGSDGTGGLVAAGSGGGAGEYSVGIFSAATIGASKAVTIGAGGTGVSGAAGNNGGNTSVDALISSNGGIGGTTGSNAASVLVQGGLGGTGGSGGNYRTPGQAGQSGYASLSGGASLGGAGGNSQVGAGGIGIASAASAGANGLGHGSGGSGSVSFGSGPQTGGNGASGIVIVTEYI